MIERGNPLCSQQGGQEFIIEDDETEPELSLGSTSFLHRVNHQVHKRQNSPQKMQQKTATNTLRFGECLCLRHWKHLHSW